MKKSATVMIKPILVVIFCIFFNACSYSLGEVSRSQNLMKYSNVLIVDLPVSEVKKALMQEFAVKKLRASEYYKNFGFKSPNTEESYITFNMTDDLSDYRFRNIAEEYQKGFLLYTLSGPWKSDCYSQQEKPSAYNASFVLNLVDLNSKTRIEVTSHNASISYDKQFNLHAGTYVSKAMSIKPSKLEEFKMVRFLQYVFGGTIEFRKDDNRLEYCGEELKKP